MTSSITPRAHSSRATPATGLPATSAVCGRGTRIVLTGAFTMLRGWSRWSRRTRESGRSTGANRTYLPATVTSRTPAWRSRARKRATKSSDSTSAGGVP